MEWYPALYITQICGYGFVPAQTTDLDHLMCGFRDLRKRHVKKSDDMLY